MTIGGIGGGGGPSGPTGPKGPGGPSAPKADGASGEFRLDGPERAQEVQTSENGDRARLERGEIGFDDYLQSRAELAVSHLQGRLSPAQLEMVKAQIVEQLESDPALTRLVQRATGVVRADLDG